MRARALVLMTAFAVTLPCDLALTSCRSATQMTVIVTTDVDCADLHDVTVTTGTLGNALETLPATSTSTSCENGYVGALVVLPSGGSDALVGIKIVGGFGTRNAEDCTPKAGSSPPDYGAGCIVARRALKYVPYTPLAVPVVLRAACNGIPCGVTETCVGGSCAPATVPGSCTNGDGCDECAFLDGGCPPAPVYGDMTDPNNWSVFDTTTVTPNAQGFAGGAFDGRYVYLAPRPSSITPPGVDSFVTRYDTQASFGATGAWSTFDTTAVAANARGFDGATFDGRYVYFVPGDDVVGNGGGVVRFDTQAAFGAVGSWERFDVKTVNAGATGYMGATFDGRFLYLVPGPFGARNLAVRYDTSAPFGAATSWATFDTLVANRAAQGFAGGVFDGRFVYLAPQSNGSADGVVPRYDTQADFTDATSWSTFDATTVSPGATFFQGAGFDGRYVYLAPAGQGSTLTRYDTFTSFGATASWSTFDLTKVNAGANGFSGAGFDGRYMYFSPFFDGQFDGLVVRYDTQATFDSAASWSTFDVTTLSQGAGGYNGAVFDGRYLYLVPNGSLVMRFDAKSPASLPGWFSGSFL